MFGFDVARPDMDELGTDRCLSAACLALAVQHRCYYTRGCSQQNPLSPA